MISLGRAEKKKHRVQIEAAVYKDYLHKKELGKCGLSSRWYTTVFLCVSLVKYFERFVSWHELTNEKTFLGKGECYIKNFFLMSFRKF